MARIKVEDWLTEDSLLKLKGWARDGLTDIEIWKQIGIGKTTFYKWMKLYPNFANAIKEGREPVIVQVEDAFINSCLGYYKTERTIIEYPDGTQVKKAVEKYYPPKVGAQIFYLKTKKPELWSDDKDNTDALDKVDELIRGLDNEAIKNAE